MIKFIAEECKEKEDHIHRLGDYCSKTTRKLQQAHKHVRPIVLYQLVYVIPCLAIEIWYQYPIANFNLTA